MGSRDGRKPSDSHTSEYIPESSGSPPPHHGLRVLGITIHARKDTLIAEGRDTNRDMVKVSHVVVASRRENSGEHHNNRKHEDV